jgi:hypothetical protein
MYAMYHVIRNTPVLYSPTHRTHAFRLFCSHFLIAPGHKIRSLVLSLTYSTTSLFQSHCQAYWKTRNIRRYVHAGEVTTPKRCFHFTMDLLTLLFLIATTTCQTKLNNPNDSSIWGAPQPKQTIIHCSTYISKFVHANNGAPTLPGTAHVWYGRYAHDFCRHNIFLCVWVCLVFVGGGGRLLNFSR